MLVVDAPASLTLVTGRCVLKAPASKSCPTWGLLGTDHLEPGHRMARSFVPNIKYELDMSHLNVELTFHPHFISPCRPTPSGVVPGSS